MKCPEKAGKFFRRVIYTKHKTALIRIFRIRQVPTMKMIPILCIVRTQKQLFKNLSVPLHNGLQFPVVGHPFDDKITEYKIFRFRNFILKQLKPLALSESIEPFQHSLLHLFFSEHKPQSFNLGMRLQGFFEFPKYTLSGLKTLMKVLSRHGIVEPGYEILHEIIAVHWLPLGYFSQLLAVSLFCFSGINNPHRLHIQKEFFFLIFHAEKNLFQESLVQYEVLICHYYFLTADPKV